ncbi:hypothetical protein [Nonomuraea dietziae]|uniref:hypothetical protein n=1 Tax=Nonomuraea dietziae TaxID=65515 RepID=UPI0033DF8CB6
MSPTQYEHHNDPALPQGGPHWFHCEGMHTQCAYELGQVHGKVMLARELDELLVERAMSDDPAARVFALREARAIVRRLVGMPPIDDSPADDEDEDEDAPYSAEFAQALRDIHALAAEQRREAPPTAALGAGVPIAANHGHLALAAYRDRREEAEDRQALAGACADEALWASPWLHADGTAC